MTITAPAALLDEIRDRAEAGYPEEVCGFLLGQVDPLTNIFVAVRIAPVENRRREETRRRYLIGPDEYRDAERRAAAEGVDVIGVYHSHPDHPARPSEYDREHAWPNLAYLIVAVNEGEAGDLTGWILAADRDSFEPLDLAAPEGAAIRSHRQEG